MTLADGHYLDDLRSLRDRQDQLRAAFEAASDAMIITDDDGRWLELNPATSTLLGGPAERLRGRRLRDFVSSPLIPVMDGATAPGWASSSGEFEVMRADGSTRVVEHRATPNIMPGRHLSILRDVTGDREAEAERTQLAAIADEFNGVLATIVGFADLLLRDLGPGDSLSRRDAMEIRRAADRATQMTAQLAPIQAQPVQPRPDPQPDHQPDALGPDAPPATGTETVLLLEDDAAVRVLTQSVLQQSGYTVLAAADPGEALTLALEYRGAIDLLVTDLVLPGMSGPQLARQLAAIGCAERVLYISSAEAISEPRRETSAPDIDLLPRPFTADGLARRVRALLDRPPR